MKSRTEISLGIKSRRRKEWKPLYKGDPDAFDPHESLRYWQERSVEEKFREVDALIQQALIIQGKGQNEPRLLRTTAVLKRI
jgi:hypothetical protein